MTAIICAFLSAALAQLLKPIFAFILTREFRPGIIFDSGSFPSSHSAAVVALTLSIGLSTDFNSFEFAIALVFSCIVMYDATNVRYYAGKNIELTKQLIHDIEKLFKHKFKDELYSDKIKTVLGHKQIEVFGGVVVGVLVTILTHMYLLPILSI